MAPSPAPSAPTPALKSSKVMRLNLRKIYLREVLGVNRKDL